MSYPFTHENHIEFIKARREYDRSLTDGNVVKLSDDKGHLALGRLLRLKKKFDDDMDKVREVMGDQYDIADDEFICRAGDPNRYNEKTGGWVIWP